MLNYKLNVIVCTNHAVSSYYANTNAQCMTYKYNEILCTFITSSQVCGLYDLYLKEFQAQTDPSVNVRFKYC